jgi:TM2 domain-containing membrane protein YozV
VTEPDKPDLTKKSTPTGESGYSQNAQTSASGEINPAPEGTGPGWSVNSSYGDGPGWSAQPSYPSPTDQGSNDTTQYGYPLGEQQQSYGQSKYNQPPTYGPTYGQQQPSYNQQPPYGPTYGQQPSYGQQQYGFTDPSAPYGRDQLTGEPLSDKSKLMAGLLQLVPLLFGLPLGIGRFYMGTTPIAIIQLVLGVAGMLLTIILIGIPIWIAAWIWVLIDGIMILAGRPRDGQGMLLKS